MINQQNYPKQFSPNWSRSISCNSVKVKHVAWLDSMKHWKLNDTSISNLQTSGIKNHQPQLPKQLQLPNVANLPPSSFQVLPSPSPFIGKAIHSPRILSPSKAIPCPLAQALDAEENRWEGFVYRETHLLCVFFWVGIFQLYLGIFCLVIDLNWFGPLGAKQNLGHQGEIKWAKQTLVTRVAVFAGQSFRFGENRWETPPWETKVNQLNPNNTIIKPCQTKLKHHLNHDKTKTAQKRRYQKDAKS